MVRVLLQLLHVTQVWHTNVGLCLTHLGKVLHQSWTVHLLLVEAGCDHQYGIGASSSHLLCELDGGFSGCTQE